VFDNYLSLKNKKFEVVRGSVKKGGPRTSIRLKKKVKEELEEIFQDENEED